MACVNVTVVVTAAAAAAGVGSVVDGVAGVAIAGTIATNRPFPFVDQQLRHTEVVSTAHHLTSTRAKFWTINRIHKAIVSKEVWRQPHRY